MLRLISTRALRGVLALGAIAAASCREAEVDVDARGPLVDAPIGPGADAADAAEVDAAASDGDAPDAPDAPDGEDGTPRRQPCTNSFGAGLTTAHGRLDGYLVSIVPTTTSDCNGDARHVHLQIEMDGSIYDVAINVGADATGVYYLAKDLPLPDGPWAEGWHPDQEGLLDYPALGVSSADFAPTARTTLSDDLDHELADANHVSVFMTGYGPDGGHLVHRNYGEDGAIVVHPLGAPRLLMFRFAGNTF
jgi:hypothetical protein